jgi:hypothetical protein
VHPGDEQLAADIQHAAMTLKSGYSKFGEANALARQFVAMANRTGGRDPEATS